MGLTPTLIAEHERLARKGVPIAAACQSLRLSTRTYYRLAKLGEAGNGGGSWPRSGGELARPGAT